MDILGFHHLAIQVQKLEAAASFYRRVLQLTELTRHFREDGSLRSIWLEVPGGGFLALEEVSGPPSVGNFQNSAPGLFLIAFRISPNRREAILAKLAAEGVPVERQTRWTLYFRDPEGNRIALSHHPEDPPANF